MSKPLSFSAQAVLDAFLKAPWDNELAVAAVLRAAADQVGEWESAEELRAIAAELDGNHDKGATALAEAILSHPGSLWQPALAQPIPVAVRLPEGPSESDVTELFYRHVGEGSEVGFEAAIEEALARWGYSTPQPIPVSERLPNAGDCDAEGRCWWFLPPQEVQPFKQNLCWVFRIRVPDDGSTWSHWLPAHALPLPQEPEPPQ